MFHDYTKSGNVCSYCTKIYDRWEDIICNGAKSGIVKTSDGVSIIQAEMLGTSWHATTVVKGVKFCPCCGRSIS